jgi:hypothetical protein
MSELLYNRIMMTTEDMPNGGACLKVFYGNFEPDNKVTHDFICRKALEKFVAKMVEGIDD